jgi:hypothetical protein
MNRTVLYKYREDSERTERIITDRKVWLSTPGTLNDPVECKTGIIPEEWKRQTIRQMEEMQVLGFLAPLGGQEGAFLSFDRQKKKIMKRIKKLPHDKRVKEMRAFFEERGIEVSNPRKIFDTFQEQLSNVGIFSLSDCSDNQPMWAHYAGNHTGLALGFSASEGSKLADTRHTLRVTYSADKPKFEAGFLQEVKIGIGPQRVVSKSKFSFDDPVLRASISTKPPAWSYEREWRYVEEIGGSYAYPGELSAMIFGYRMSKERRAHYRNLVGQLGKSVDLFEIDISLAGSFELRPLSSI